MWLINSPAVPAEVHQIDEGSKVLGFVRQKVSRGVRRGQGQTTDILLTLGNRQRARLKSM